LKAPNAWSVFDPVDYCSGELTMRKACEVSTCNFGSGMRRIAEVDQVSFRPDGDVCGISATRVVGVSDLRSRVGGAKRPLSSLVDGPVRPSSTACGASTRSNRYNQKIPQMDRPPIARLSVALSARAQASSPLRCSVFPSLGDIHPLRDLSTGPKKRPLHWRAPGPLAAVGAGASAALT
jgi:hypothetical protein